MSVLIPPGRIQAVLMGLANLENIKNYGIDSYFSSSFKKSEPSYYRVDPETTSGNFIDIEKQHMRETATFSPNAVFDSKTSKEIFFPVTRDKEWIEKKFDEGNKYKPVIIDYITKNSPSQNRKTEDNVINTIEEQSNVVEPGGKPLTYFDGYSLLVFHDQKALYIPKDEDFSFINYTTMYSLDVTELYKYNIRLNNLEIVNQAKDQFTSKIDFTVKMEFNFASMEDIETNYLTFKLEGDKTKPANENMRIPDVTIEVLESNSDVTYGTEKSLVVSDIINGKIKFGIRIRSYFDTNFYPKLTKILNNNIISITSASPILFNSYDAVFPTELLKNYNNDRKKLLKDVYKLEPHTRTYCYIDKIFRLQFIEHDIKFYSNRDSSGNAMNFPHKLTITFSGWTDQEETSGTSIYMPVMDEYNKNIAGHIEWFKNQEDIQRQKCFKEVEKHKPQKDEKTPKDFQLDTTEYRKKIDELRDQLQVHINNLQSITSFKLIHVLLKHLNFYNISVPFNLFNIVEYQNGYDAIMETLVGPDKSKQNAISAILLSPFIGAPLAFGAAAATSATGKTLVETFIKNDAEIFDLSWINLLSAIEATKANNPPGSIFKVAQTKTAGSAAAAVIKVPKDTLASKAAVPTEKINDELKKELESFIENFSKSSDSKDEVNVTYFYLGELINLIINILNQSGGQLGKGVYLTGNYIYKNYVKADTNSPKTYGNAELLNIADIPVSVALFTEFMKEKLLERNNFKYDCQTFLKDILNDLIKGTMQKVWTGEVDNPLKINELKKFIPYNTYISKIKLYGLKENLFNTLLPTKLLAGRQPVEGRRDPIVIKKYKLAEPKSNDFENPFVYSDNEDLQKISEVLLQNSFSPIGKVSYDLNYISCLSDHTYIDFYEQYEEKRDGIDFKNTYGYNSLPFMEHIIENFYIPCIILQRTNVIPQIIGSTSLDLSRIDDANLKVANSIAQQNILKSFRYQGTIPLHSMYIHFLDIGSNIFISPGSFAGKGSEYSGLYLGLKSTYTKKFDTVSAPAEYKIDVRQESTGIQKLISEYTEEDKNIPKAAQPNTCPDVLRPESK